MKKKINIVSKSIIALFAMMLFSCENDVEKIKIITEKENLADYSAENVTINYTDSSKIQLRVSAPKIQKYTFAEKPFTEFPKGISVVHFINFPDTNSMIRANSAIKWDEEKYWEAMGNVVAKNSKGETLNTEYLVWDEKKEIIYSDKQVMITTKEDIIFGEGFTADQTFENWKIKKVKGFINVAEQ